MGVYYSFNDAIVALIKQKIKNKQYCLKQFNAPLYLKINTILLN